MEVSVGQVKVNIIFLGILQVVRFEVWEVLVMVLNVGGGMLIISDSGSGEVWFEPPLLHLLSTIHKRRNVSGVGGGGGGLKEVWFGLCC